MDLKRVRGLLLRVKEALRSFIGKFKGKNRCNEMWHFHNSKHGLIISEAEQSFVVSDWYLVILFILYTLWYHETCSLLTQYA